MRSSKLFVIPSGNENYGYYFNPSKGVTDFLWKCTIHRSFDLLLLCRKNLLLKWYVTKFSP